MKTFLPWFLSFALALALAPLQLGVVNKVKAFFAGRRGPRLLQLYFDLAKLARKNPVRSETSSWVLAAAPVTGLAAVATAACLFPFGGFAPPVSLPADAVLFFYLLGLARFAAVLGAFDTSSAFCGMGAARELQFSALAELVVFAVLPFLLLLQTGSGDISLHGLLVNAGAAGWTRGGIASLLAAAAFFTVLLVECCRVPFDDPETHLELTMIHEAMILDYAGPDLALILYTAALKMWLLASFLVFLAVPVTACGAPVCLLGVFAVSALVGVTESVMARFRFLKSPQTILGAFALALVAVTLLVSLQK